MSLHAELAIDYFELRGADAQKQLFDDTVKAYTDVLELAQNRFHGGLAPRSDVAQAQTQLDTTRAQDTDVTVARAQSTMPSLCSSANHQKNLIFLKRLSISTHLEFLSGFRRNCSNVGRTLPQLNAA